MIGEAAIRVRYAETDTMGVVYYGNYLTYFEVGRVEFLRQNGLAMSEVDRRVRMPVVEATVRYVKPARLDDLLRVQCWVGERKRASFLFRYEIRHAESGELIATGETRHACWHPETQRMIAIPEWLAALLVPEAATAGGARRPEGGAGSRRPRTSPHEGTTGRSRWAGGVPARWTSRDQMSSRCRRGTRRPR